MKLSEKYLNRIEQPDSCLMMTKERAMVYGQICGLEAQQTLLVANPYSIPQEKQLELLATIVNQLQEIAEKEKL